MHTIFSAASRLCIPTALLLVAACSDGGTTPQGPPSLLVVSGAGTVDSIQAVIPPLVIEVRDGRGRPVSGAAVEFAAQMVPGTFVPAVYIHTTTGQYGPVASGHTDAGGRATLNLAMGGTPGATYVRFAVLSLGLRDSARYEVRPGAAARVTVTPRDTTVTVGATYTVRVAARDRQGNVTSATPSFAARSPVVSVTGATVKAEAVGRTYVVTQSEVYRDSVAVSVVPAGTLSRAGQRPGN
jgi:hypothetical protein